MSNIAKRIAQFPQEYKELQKGKLSKRQIEILDGDDLKSHEGMMFGQMYSHWKELTNEDTE
tara:strand:- start:389 stop:571 length:183 start_codon:yes stop_codon:yes gene_type:complete